MRQTGAPGDAEARARRNARALAAVAALALLRALADWPTSHAAPPRTPPSHGAARLLYGAPLDPNREPADVIAALPGIGPQRAASIVAARPFCGLGDIDRVAGVGPKTLRNVAGLLTFDDPPGDCER
jgi:DNA uptake protein ComE-like DNA-binding protein